MKAALLGLILLALSGCAALGNEGIFHTCRALDTASTIVILKHGGVELNPILATVIHTAGYPGLILVEIGIAYAAHRWWPSGNNSEHVLANAVSCAPVLFNARSL